MNINISEKDFKNYQKNGWIKISNFIDKKNTLKAKNLINNFIKKNIKKKINISRHVNFISSKKRNNIKNLNSFHQLVDSPWIKNFATKKKNLLLIEKFLESKPKYKASELFAKPAKKGLASPVHQDNYYWAVKNSRALTVWIALDDSNKNNGGIFYYQGSHKFGILDHTPSFAKGSSQTVKNKVFLKKFKKVYPRLKKGDALIHHCLVVHGSNKNVSKKNRKGWTLQYKDKFSKFDLRQKKKYEKSLKLQLLLRKNNNNARI
jgi:phytanoyl-CoA hydroxylase